MENDNDLIMTAMKIIDSSKETLNFLVNRTINVYIRTTYYIFCIRNKERENPSDVLQTSRVICSTTESVTVREYEQLQICLFTNKIHVKFKNIFVNIIISTIIIILLLNVNWFCIVL